MLHFVYFLDRADSDIKLGKSNIYEFQTRLRDITKRHGPLESLAGVGAVIRLNGRCTSGSLPIADQVNSLGITANGLHRRMSCCTILPLIMSHYSAPQVVKSEDTNLSMSSKKRPSR
jgi:hypothetical protein